MRIRGGIQSCENPLGRNPCFQAVLLGPFRTLHFLGTISRGKEDQFSFRKESSTLRFLYKKSMELLLLQRIPNVVELDQNWDKSLVPPSFFPFPFLLAKSDS